MSSRYIPYAFDINATQEFYGGQSSDVAIGPPNSFSYSRALDHRRNPSQLSVLPGPRQLSAGVVNDLILNIAQVQNGNRYAYGDQGYLYKIDTSNVMTFAEKLANGSDGMIYRQDSDAIYLATSTDLQRYYPISGTPDLDVIYGPSRSSDSHAYRTGGASTYSVPTTLNEVQSCSFQPDIEPFYSIKVKIVAPGTGNWTLTLHDGLNNVLATSTVNAPASGLVEFVFGSQIRALVKPNARTYHFHLTSTIAGGTIACSTAGDLSTADFELWAYRLIDTVNGFHPMVNFQQFILIGNERYCAVWEPLTERDPPNNEFQRHRLTLPTGFEICGITASKGFAYIAAEKISTNASKDFQEGLILKWDVSSTTYDDYVEVSGGSPESISMKDNFPYFYVNGTLHAWPGGDTIVKVKTLANTSTDYKDVIDATRVYPNMMTVRDNLLHLGYPSTTTNTSVEYGVYVWGSLDKDYSASFNYGYVASTMQSNTKNIDGTRQLGCVKNFGDEMYISWKDGSNYGLDIVDSFCDPAPIFQFRNRRFSAGAVHKDKQALSMTIDSDTIPTGTIITPVHSIDQAADTLHDEKLTVGERNVKTEIKSGIFRTITYGFDGTCTGTQSPIIYSTALEWNPLVDRRRL